MSRPGRARRRGTNVRWHRSASRSRKPWHGIALSAWRGHAGSGRRIRMRATVNGTVWHFADLKTLLARATPKRSGDALAGIAASCAAERVAAQLALADLPLARFLDEAVIPYETDEVTRLILDRHDPLA